MNQIKICQHDDATQTEDYITGEVLEVCDSCGKLLAVNGEYFD